MFIDKEDYIQVSADALKIMQQATDSNRVKAELRAIDLIKGYLRDRYDTEAIFAAEGEERNMTIVGYTIDITLFYLVCSLPQKMGYEIRKELYDQAIAWLKDVQKGNVMLDLPTITGTDGQEDANNPIKYGTGIKNKYFW